MQPLLHALLALSSCVAGADEEALDRARKLLGANEESDCRKGTEICTQENSVAAVELSEKTREKTLAFVAEQRLGGNKDIWQALESVLADPAIDTVFLLSSGEPEVGTYVHWNRVVWHLRDLNRFRKLVVHAVAYNEHKGYRDHLEQIAKATGGEFVWFE